MRTSVVLSLFIFIASALQSTHAGAQLRVFGNEVEVQSIMYVHVPDPQCAPETLAWQNAASVTVSALYAGGFHPASWGAAVAAGIATFLTENSDKLITALFEGYAGCGYSCVSVPTGYQVTQIGVRAKNQPQDTWDESTVPNDGELGSGFASVNTWGPQLERGWNTWCTLLKNWKVNSSGQREFPPRVAQIYAVVR